MVVCGDGCCLGVVVWGDGCCLGVVVWGDGFSLGVVVWGDGCYLGVVVWGRWLLLRGGRLGECACLGECVLVVLSIGGA